MEISSKGSVLLDTPMLNKGSAFPEDERHEIGLLGLLPFHVSTIAEQLDRTYANYKAKGSDLERYIFLTALQDRNEAIGNAEREQLRAARALERVSRFRLLEKPGAI